MKTIYKHTSTTKYNIIILICQYLFLKKLFFKYLRRIWHPSQIPLTLLLQGGILYAQKRVLHNLPN
jgi:hypothetical protein